MRALLLLFCFFSFTCFSQEDFGGYIEYNFESSTPDKITTKFSARKLHAGATYNGLHKKVVLKLGIGLRYTFITDVVMPRFQKGFLNDIDENYSPIESPEYDSLLASSVHNWHTESPGKAGKLSATNLEFGILLKTRFFPSINIYRGSENLVYYSRQMTGYEGDMYNDDGYIYINYKNISVDLGIIIPLDTYVGINLKAGVRYVNYNNINFDHTISKLNLDQFTTGNLKNKYSKATTYFFSIGIIGATFIKKHSHNETNI